ncbi:MULTISPECIES: sugar phosphate isomerase/epimerase [unclassified Oceanispirochaeta]|uniref:D-psicose 3-epimerase n=1 Tax=unclassified Oceanispirochaeta TaxID=2635722 RepID=UPI000E09CA4A|nr:MULTISPECIES: sugar phosphate isomerase/epimerase family protein [unclassified Oceanispirochaeta]MBF9018542.1 sugar phosphate isomerase/epimerase [Oceanispirochaeta sp. M2]NPD74949.1 sugar phosphate isomerase/epimerase [Oceanispirochaeta sp. M1]RDG29180.1 sugar phosphate isomerase/epimerase [Oceanispirochaeta sp. M1]
MDRKIGIYYAYWADSWDVDFFPYIKKVKILGFDQLEIQAAAVADLDIEKRRDLKREADEQDITLSYGIGLTADNDVSSLHEETRIKGVEFMKRVIKAVSSIDGKMISGTVHSYWPAVPPQGLTDKQAVWDQSIKSMKELVKVAEDHDVILNVEVINRFEQFLLNTSEEAVKYVEQVGSPYCRILLDTFHMNIEEDSIEDAIKRCGPYLSALHIGETNRKPPGCGRMPWLEIKKALDDIQFTGSLVMEPFVLPGGQVGRDIALWRELMPGADLDEEAAKAVRFVRDTLC